ncbi:MAG: cysteine--tRNA ligase [Desulfobacterales bacterium]|jgi:cysteinyl-tRNA synthetase|nr:cysteine--tRNA ligase [Desulfobacterales bacterium]
MPIRIYNTLTRSKEIFEPMTPGKVRMYVCGPTVYDSCHIGHARSAVIFDVIYRYLVSNGYEVIYIRNFTDVDDKIIQRANSLGISTEALAEKYINEFHLDMDALKNVRPTIEPKATEHIEQIVSFIGMLFQKGFAYAVEGDVYFSVESFSEYGKLSGRKLDDMEAGARVEVDPRKRNPFDFVLWKASKPNEPSWDSPWGRGRPGWHIECSAMSADYLGESFDIHGGGKDLIFPHHENEIAQSEAAFGKHFVKYWVHNGFVNINQEKMSKSLNNFQTIKDILNSYHPEALRLFLLSNHYRSPVDFNEQAMRDASVGLEKMYSVLERIEKTLGMIPDIKDTTNIKKQKAQDNSWKLFCNAMDDDFNSALGIGILFEAIRRINRSLDETGEKNSSPQKDGIAEDCADILRMANILGILSETPSVYFERKKQVEVQKKSIDPEKIEKMILDREVARKAKDFKKADEIRTTLKSLNVQIEDRPGGTIWKFIE